MVRISQPQRFDLCYREMVKSFGDFYKGNVLEIIYIRNQHEYSESGTNGFAKCTIKYLSQSDLVQLGHLPPGKIELPIIDKYVTMYFYDAWTTVEGMRVFIDPTRHRKNQRIYQPEDIFLQHSTYEGYMTSDVVRQAIKSYELNTFLKLGDINEYEDTSSVF